MVRMGVIKRWWKKKRGKVRGVAKRIIIGLGVGLALGGGATLLPWYGRLAAGLGLGLAEPDAWSAPTARIAAAVVSPWVGVGASVVPAARARRPEWIAYAAVSSYFGHRWLFHRGSAAAGGATWAAALEAGVWL